MMGQAATKARARGPFLAVALFMTLIGSECLCPTTCRMLKQTCFVKGLSLPFLISVTHRGRGCQFLLRGHFEDRHLALWWCHTTLIYQVQYSLDGHLHFCKHLLTDGHVLLTWNLA